MWQEAQAEVQQLCGEYAWLTDMRSFTDQWGASSSLEALRGGAVSAYEELVGEMRRWSDRVRRAPRSFHIAGRLFDVDSSVILEELGGYAFPHVHRSRINHTSSPSHVTPLRLVDSQNAPVTYLTSHHTCVCHTLVVVCIAGTLSFLFFMRPV